MLLNKRNLFSVVTVALLGFGAFSVAVANEETLLSHSTSLAYRGELTESTEIRALESLFIETKQIENRILAAYLLTYAPGTKTEMSVDTYLEYVLGNAKSESVLGTEAIIRLLRIRADAAYEKGEFPLAIADYEKMRKASAAPVAKKDDSNPAQRSFGFLSDYATLKLGWSYMNLKKPHDAFQLWLNASKADPEATSTALSPTLMQGLGQALAEDVKRSEKDIAELDSLKLGDQARKSAVDGIVDGLETVGQISAQELFAAQSHGLNWRPEVVKAVFGRSRASGDKACRLLVWLENSPAKNSESQNAEAAKLPYEPFGPVVESCAHWTKASPKNATRQTGERLSLAFPLLDLHGVQRRARFDWFQNQPAAACAEGLDWAAEHHDIKDRELFPVKSTAEICNKSMTPELAARLISVTSESARATGQLTSKDQPLLFLLVSLLPNKDVKNGLLRTIETDPEIYRHTLVPTLLAERFHKDKETQSAYALSQVMLASPSVGESSSASAEARTGIWHDIFSARVAQVLNEGKTEDAKNLVESRYPLGQANAFDATASRSWMTLLLESEKKTSEKGFVESTLVTLTPSMARADRDVRTAFFELTLRHSDLKSLRSSLEQTPAPLAIPKSLSERIEFALFTDATTSESEPAPSKHKELAYAEALGSAAGERDVAAVLALNPVGKSPLSDDAKYLRQLDKTKRTVLTQNRKKNLVSKIPGWVQFLKQNVRSVQKRKWSHDALFSTAKTMVADFCSQAHVQLEDGIKAGIKPEWAPMLSTLDARLNDCIKSAQPSQSKPASEAEST